MVFTIFYRYAMKQSLTLLLAILLGILLPQLHVLSPFITYLLGIMLFTSFLRAKLSWKIFTEKKVYLVFLCNLIIPWGAYFLLLPWGQELAFIAFFVGIIPTAMAAPAVVSVLKGNVEFVIASVIITNFGIGILLPFFSSYISPVMFSTWAMLIKIFLLLGIPFVGAEFIKAKMPHIKTKLTKNTSFVFYIWASIIIIAMANASHFLYAEWKEYSDILIPIFCIAGILCVVNFGVGYIIGGKQFRTEASQSLGQKNPMLMIWIALEFFTPLVALGPTFYILFHNLVNAYKMMRSEKKKS